jgi:tight adherence protein B
MAKEEKEYGITYKELLLDLLVGAIRLALIGFLFYRSLYASLFLSPGLYLYLRKKRKERKTRRQWQLNLEFRDAIAAVSAALCAGYSAENAFEEALKDLSLIYPKEAIILRELTHINNQIRLNIPVESALTEFGERSGIEDIISFAEVFSTAKRTGGDLIQVIRVTSSSLSDKLEVKREILTLLSAKKLEAEIMKIVPLGIIGYLSLSSPGFLNPLYHNLLGIILMTVLLLLYLAAIKAVDKIVSIEV